MQRLIVLVWLLFAPFIAHADRALPQEPEIERVIGAQMEAFTSGNIATAWDFASPNIQRIFQTPDYFGAMVARGYPMVWRPAEVRYLGLREGDDGQIYQRIQVVDGEGRLHLLDYQMVPIDGQWRINGVALLRGEAVGA